MNDIVVATRDLEMGVRIGPSDLQVAKWPGLLPKGALAKPEAAVNRATVAAVYQGEPLLTTRLAPVGSGAGLAAIIPPGMRACAVRVNEVVGLAGFVTPGMRVDVLMAGLPPGGNAADGPRVRTLLQNIQVLSAGANIQKDAEGKPQPVQVVNLLVTPEQAEALSLASNQTHIQLVLRNPTDTQLAAPPGTIMKELFGVPTHAPPPPAQAAPEEARRGRAPARPAGPPAAAVAAKMRTVEVLNGATRTEAKFDLREDPQ